jgi:phosphatidate cytidylyltransferase
MGNLLKRLKTAFFFVFIMLVAILLNQYGFILIFGVICVMALWEFHCILYHDLTGRKRSKRIIANVVLGSIPYFVVGLYFLGSPFFDIGRLFALGILLFLSISVYYIIELASRLEKPFVIISYALSGTFYVTVPCIMVIAIAYYSGEYDYTPVLGLLILTWLNDTGAFLVGSTLGKNLLFPRISPKKTWEGFWGGGVITLLISYPVSMIFPVFSLYDWIILGVIVIIFGTLGDLIESMFKRSTSVKDSGSILPGHGGFLDRFDSFLFMLPFAAFYIFFVKN